MNKIEEPCMYLFLINHLVSYKMFQPINLKFSYIEVWLLDQSSKPLEIKDYVINT